MKRTLTTLLSLLLCAVSVSIAADGDIAADGGTVSPADSSAPASGETGIGAGRTAKADTATAKKRRRPTLVLGRRIARDTTNVSRRSLRTHLIVPKHDWQIGMAASYVNLSADNSEFLLLLNNSNAYLSLAKISLNGAFAYCDNHAVGVRLQYTNGNCAVDAATLDLLGNFSYEFKDVKAKTFSYSGAVFNRSYVGFDSRGRVGVFLDTGIGYTKSRSELNMSAGTYTVNNKLSLSLSPGVVYFPMNTISVFAFISLADISYNNSKAYSNWNFTGERNFFRAQARIDLLSVSLGLSVHL